MILVSDFHILYNFYSLHAFHSPHRQGLTGMAFQLRVGSGSGIGKNFGFGFGYGSGSGIGTAFFFNRVLSGIENLDRVFFGYIPDEVFSFGSTKVLAALGRWTLVHDWSKYIKGLMQVLDVVLVEQ